MKKILRVTHYWHLGFVAGITCGLLLGANQLQISKARTEGIQRMSVIISLLLDESDDKVFIPIAIR